MKDTELETWLRRRIAELARTGSGDEISVHEPLAAYGLSSIDAVALAGELGTLLGRKVSPTVAYEFPTLGEILDHLQGRLPARGGPTAARRAATAGTAHDEPIAIIGMGCRFPGADGPEAFWDLLERGVDAVGRVPDDRFVRWGRGDGGSDRAGVGGFLDGVGGLDLDFFGISEHEAAKIDPQQRLMLEVAWEAVEDAGIDPYGLAGSDTGVFVGISSSDYREVLANSPSADAYSLLGGASCVAANRLSYVLDLRGPSLSVDTACSSSLVAVHLACEAIRRGECGVAVVGGVNVILTPAITEAFDHSGVMAPDGRCKAFSADADGYVRSEGAGAVVLKPLSEALRDGDRVSAVIRGSAVTSDGRTNGLLAPSRRAQEDVVRLALAGAGARPSEVGYVEAHGTGTAIGDQIEAAALGTVLNQDRAGDRPCAIGSVKTNLGHLEAAAGIAGLIKLALCFEHGALPPSLHCAQPHPDIDFDGLGLRVQTSLRRWESPEEPGLAGVSSFGFGGTNAHAVLGPAPDAGAEAETPAGDGHPVRVLALSAATEAALRAQAAAHAAWAAGVDERELDRDAAAATLLRGRGGPRGREFRAAFAFADKEELLGRLREPFTAGRGVPDGAGVVFVFPGQGAQWLGMGRALLESEPAFDLAVSRCEQAFAPYVDWSLREVLTEDGAAPLLERIDVVQPALFAMQVALAAVFRSWGVRPAGVVGHSMGEVAAAHVAGALRLEDAARIICRRSALMMRHRGQGAMALVSLPVSDVRKALEPYGERLSLAAHNGPGTTVVSGETAAVEEFAAAMDAQGVFCRRVKVDVASHCALLEDLREDLTAELSGLSPRASTAAFYSSLAGERLGTQALDAGYWWRNLREPVLFADAVRTAGAAGHRVFLEISPHPLLSVSVAECLEDDDRAVAAVPAMRRSDGRAPYEAVAALFEAGCEIDWAAFFGGRPRAGSRLPSYPWQRQEHWIEPEAPRAEGALVTGALPVIRDHRVQERAIAPAAWMLDAALKEIDPDRAGGYGLSDVLVTNPLAVAGGEARHVRVSRRLRAGGEPFLSVESRAAGERGSAWEEHLRATWSEAPAAPDAADLSAIRLRCPRRVEPDALYEQLAASGLSYGDSMRMVTGMWLGEKELLTLLAPPSPRTAGRPLPADVADGAMQSIAGLSLDGGASGTFVGFGYGRVDVFAPWSGPALAHVRLRGELQADADTFDCDVDVLDPDGRVLVRFTAVSLKRMRTRHSLRFFAVDARPQERAVGADATAAAPVVLLTADAGRCAALVEELGRGGAECSVAPLPGEEEAAAFLESLPERARLLVVEPEREAFLAFLRSAARLGSAGRRELALVTGDVALPPLLRALEQETVGWAGRAVRVEPEELATRELARDIAAELAAPPAEFCVRYRHGERTVPSLTPVEPASGEADLRPGGVYWITGGQGGLGSTLAVALAREAGARVVLTGRRAEVDPRLEEAVDAAGGRLLYLQADVTDAAAVRRALDETLRRFGALHGVIHTAGILDDALVESTSAERMNTITGPKEQGARILLDAVASEDLDFIVLFSSMASLFVTAGQGAYAAGNATLDALTGTVRSRRTPVRTVNWGPWAELGMVADPKYQAQLLESGLHPMAPEAGADAFLRTLGSSHLQLAVLDVGDEVADGLVARFNRGHGQAGTAPRARAARPEGAAGSAADFVRAELARALRRSPAEIDTSARFDRLGVDSLLAVSLTRRIGAHFGLELPATFMFNHRTVDAVGLHLEGLLGPAEPETADAPPVLPAQSAQEVTLDGAELHSTVPGYTIAAGPSGLDMRLRDVPVRTAGPGEVVIDVQAVGVNFIDVLATTGFHPFLSAPPFVPGHEVAGVVHAVGEGVEHVRPGDAVIALTPDGGYAARVTTAAYTVAPLPAGVSAVDAVSVLISGLTAIACLEREARVFPGDRVLVQAAAGATGTACVQLALHHGATVFGTASTEAKLEHLRALGVQYPVNYAEADFADAVRELSPDQGLDLVVDSLSGDAVGRGLELLRAGGRFIEIGAAGVLDLAVDGRELFMSSRSFCTVNVGALARDPSRLRPLMDRLVELIDAGVLRPSVGGVFAFEDAPQAITQLRNRANIGKFVVTVS